VIGDRTSFNRNQYKTTNGMFQAVHNLQEVTTNGGILAERVKWTHTHQNMP
jgi:hypothetical protein